MASGTREPARRLDALRPGPGELPYLLLLLAAAAIGVYARFRGAGAWPLSYDEYFMGKSVRSILQTGLPGMAGGGYYPRGILVQYLMALVRATGAGEELSLRLVTILFNLAALPALLLLGRKLGGYRAACLAGAAFLLSAWEIEFARFGRMYAPFQAFFLWFAYFLHGLVVEKRESCRAWLYGLALAGIFVHEGSVFLVALSFLPPLLDRERLRARDVAIPALLLILAVAFNGVDFRGTRAAAKAGGSAVGSAAGKVILPGVVAIPALAGLTPWSASCALLLAFCGYVVYRTVRDARVPTPARWTLGAFTALCGLNLFSAAACLAAAAALAGWLRREDLRGGAWKLPGAAALAALAYWIAYLLASRAVQAQIEQFGPWRPLSRYLLGWPDLVGRVFYMWAGALPVFLVLTALLLPAALWLARDGGPGRAAGTRLAALSALVVLCLVGVLRTPWYSTRYVFVVFPLFLLLDACALASIAGRSAGETGWKAHAALLVPFAAFLALSDDVREAHLFRADSREVNFRIGYPWYDTHHYVPRFDYRSPARFIDGNRRDGDLVVSSVLQVEFYLRRPPDFVFIDIRDREFRNHAVAGGKRERWSGTGLVSSEAAFDAAVLGQGRTVWLVACSPTNPFAEPFDRTAASRYGGSRVFTSVDGAFDVYRVDPGASGARGADRETRRRVPGL